MLGGGHCFTGGQREVSNSAQCCTHEALTPKDDRLGRGAGKGGVAALYLPNELPSTMLRITAQT